MNTSTLNLRAIPLAILNSIAAIFAVVLVAWIYMFLKSEITAFLPVFYAVPYAVAIMSSLYIMSTIFLPAIKSITAALTMAIPTVVFVLTSIMICQNFVFTTEPSRDIGWIVAGIIIGAILIIAIWSFEAKKHFVFPMFIQSVLFIIACLAPLAAALLATAAVFLLFISMLPTVIILAIKNAV